MKSIFASRRNKSPHNNEEAEKQDAPFFGKENKTPFFNSSNGGAVQTKLKVGQPGDKYEKEADSMADAVVGNRSKPNIQNKEISTIQRESLATPQEDEKLGTAEQRMEEDKLVQEKPEVQKMGGEKKEEEMVSKMEGEEEEEMVSKMEGEEEEMVSKKEGEEEEEGMVSKKEGPEEEEETLQTKSNGSSTTASSGLTQQIKRKSGKGKAMSKNTRAEMEASFGRDFSGVNIHTDQDAVKMNKELGAQAFTHGSDIYFNNGKFNPESSGGRQLLAHELTHVVQQGAVSQQVKADTKNDHSGIRHHTTHSAIHRQGLLSAAQEQSAISFNNTRYDLRSRMIIQIITGAAVDGVIGSQTVEAITTFQNTNGLGEDGKVGDDTLNAIVRDRVADNSREHAIQLVVDFFDLDHSQTLSITFDPSIFLANTTFEPGGVRVIRVGTFAFLSAGILRSAIASQLALPGPAIPAAGPRPNHLSTGQEIVATNFNHLNYTDLRSIMILQGLVGSSPDGQFGPDTAERIAEFQNTNGLTVDGKAGEQTLREMVQQLDAAGQQNSAIRLIIDFFNLSEHNALLDISFDPTLTTSNASTGGDIPGPSIIRIGPPAFARGFEGLVHTIAHELEHVRQRREGILNQDEREFLGEEVEILSIGMPEENTAGFFSDARRALLHWNRLPAADRRRLFNRFTGVRNKVRQRFNAASAADQVTHQPTLNSYNAVVRP